MNLENFYLWFILRVPDVQSYTMRKMELFFLLLGPTNCWYYNLLQMTLEFLDDSKILNESQQSVCHIVLCQFELTLGCTANKTYLAISQFLLFSFSTYSLVLPMSPFCSLVLVFPCVFFIFSEFNSSYCPKVKNAFIVSIYLIQNSVLDTLYVSQQGAWSSRTVAFKFLKKNGPIRKRYFIISP